MTAESESEMKSRMNESEAILRAREGDAEGFEYLYDSHRKHVYSVCLRMLKNSADAEDLMQQAFLQVFRKIGTFRGESGFSTWLHRVTINAVLMHLRRQKPTEALAEEVDSAAANGEASGELGAEDASLLGAVDRLNLRRALHRLPSRYRLSFGLVPINAHVFTDMVSLGREVGYA
jgi:RNA polymerase sigma-70 factor (ECF subfamily)